MMHFRNADEALAAYAHELLVRGREDDSRAGKTKELTFEHFTLRRPLERELTLEHRKANLAAQIAETMWVLGGRNDVEWLSRYLPRAADFSDDGQVWRAGYGPRLRSWMGTESKPDTDQLAEVIRLLKEDPTTRRAVMSLWDPATDYAASKDIPCNNWLHFLARDRQLHLHVAIRSNDLIWGWSGINQFEWSVLLEVVAAYTGLQVGYVHYAVSSLHIYDRHWEKAAALKPSTPSFPATTFRFNPHGLEWDLLVEIWFEVEEQIRSAEFTAYDIERFPEPMLRSWLWVLAWWWTGDEDYLATLSGTRLKAAALAGMQPRRPSAHDPGTAMDLNAEAGSPFIQYVTGLHDEKHAAYGDSWKARGELFSILPNIARKVDRLAGGADTSDETQADTAVDLLVYLAKYQVWLADNEGGARAHQGTATTEETNRLLREMDKVDWSNVRLDDGAMVRNISSNFDRLLQQVEAKSSRQVQTVRHMRQLTYPLARARWESTQDDYLGADRD